MEVLHAGSRVCPPHGWLIRAAGAIPYRHRCMGPSARAQSVLALETRCVREPLAVSTRQGGEIDDAIPMFRLSPMMVRSDWTHSPVPRLAGVRSRLSYRCRA